MRKSYYGDLWTQDKAAADEHDLNYIESVPGNGFIEDQFRIMQGQNSGYQAINLAYHLGARRVILLGYDMHSHSGKDRWHKDHPGNCGNHGTHSQFIKNFDHMHPPIEVINCSRKTALNAFPKQDLDSLLQSIID